MRDIVVKKFKGDRALQHGLNDMARKGYVVDQQASRKAMYSPMTGVFTKKQIHTVTFRKQGTAPTAPAEPAAAAPRPTEPAAPLASEPPPAAPAPTVDVIDHLERLGRLRDSGVLTAEEFEAQKAVVLGTSAASAEVTDSDDASVPSVPEPADSPGFDDPQASTA